MIFVTVGTQLPFDRLLRAVDNWAEQNPKTEVFAQTGNIGPKHYRPRHVTWETSLDPAAFNRRCRDAELIVAHAGTGSILKSFEFQTPILIMPRKAALDEHRNDHQIATAKSLGNRIGVHCVFDEAELPIAIDRLLSEEPKAPELSEFADGNLISAVRDVVFPSN